MIENRPCNCWCSSPTCLHLFLCVFDCFFIFASNAILISASGAAANFVVTEETTNSIALQWDDVVGKNS